MITTSRFFSLAALLGPATCIQVLSGFESPSGDFRPKFRYWLPDASVSVKEVTNDIHALKDVGAGGLEFVPFYNYGFGDPKTPPASEWDVYGFGTSAFQNIFRTALNTAHGDGLCFDFALGASQGQGAPVEPLTPGLAVELVYGETTIRGGKTFKGAVPKPNVDFNFLPGFMHEMEHFGPNKMVAVVAGGIKSTKSVSDSTSEVILDESSLIDVSDSVHNGELIWQAPRDYERYVIFGLYERYTNQRSCTGAVNPQNAVANGSWITDHFSAQGAALVIDFWEKHILDADIKQILKATGQHTWEDSMEMQASLWWTPDFIKRFEANRGYSPARYLPLMFHQSNSWGNKSAPYNTTYLLNSSGSDQNKYLQDYRTTLNEGYIEYLQAYEEWANSLGLTHSCQVAYNLPLDMSGDVSRVSGPELESLMLADIDHSLQFVGAAHLGGSNVVSIEVGAVHTGGYSLSVPSLVNLFRDAFAGGVNSMVIHGMQYGGEYMATWPGYTPFQYAFTELWGPRQPAWEFMNDTIAYTARNQLALRAGKPKLDIAFYLYKEPWSASTVYEGDDLRAQGFTHEYLGPANLASEEAIIEDRILAPDGPAYKALVFYHQKYITRQAARNVVEFAKKGLPIVVYGSLPTTAIGASGQDVVTEAMASMEHFSNVKLVDDSQPLPAVLRSLGVQPRLSVKSSRPARKLYSVWRATDNLQIVYLYNKGASAAYELSFEVGSDKAPYMLNAWTGHQEPILVYKRSRGDKLITVPLSLAENQTTIVAFGRAKDLPKLHVVSHSDNVEKVQQGYEGRLAVLVNDGKESKATLSNGQVVKFPGLPGSSKLPAVEVDPWNLTIESWVPSPDSSTSRSAIHKLHLGPQKKLVPWSKIPLAQNASGVGIYTTSFIIPKTPYQTATLIHFGPILGTLRAWVNGKLLPAVDCSNAALDISDYLRSGKNTLEVRVSGTLFNAVKARVDWVKNWALGPLIPAFYTEQDWQRYGLIGPVEIRVLRKCLPPRMR